MTSRPPQTFPPDAFVGHDSVPHTSDSRPLLSAPVTSAPQARVKHISHDHVHTSQLVNLPPHTNSSHDGTRGTEPASDDSPTSSPLTRPRLTQFRSQTICPSPPLSESGPEDRSESHVKGQYLPSPLAIGTTGSLYRTSESRPNGPLRTDSYNTACGLTAPTSLQNLNRKPSSSSLKIISRTPSLKQALAHNIGSACSSAVSSPIITAMGDITPLPSPLLIGDSPGPWRKLGARPPSRGDPLPTIMPDSVLVTTNGESVASALANQTKRKTYAGLKGGGPAEKENGGDNTHGRNRSISEYVPDPTNIPRRQITVSGSYQRAEVGFNGVNDQHLRREPNYSAARGLLPAAQPPTPPPSESSHSNDGASALKRPRAEFFDAHGRNDSKLRRWRALKQLGEGTFSRVMLATSQVASGEEGHPESTGAQLPDLKTLVAVKVCEHGPRGGASETRIEMSLKRELEIMRSIHHPSLVYLKAWNIEPTRALLVLSYCPGGDLFDVATRHRDLLTPALLRRMFAELVGAVKYLHDRRIVHRDIKLENVLVNIPTQDLADPTVNWATYSHSIITLTDLGLSRFVADDEKLETRCGSDDYAAPEVILGQPYDGRAIDAWSMGVLLYALLESRLPFDPPPGASDALRMRSRTSHRIARVEWKWIDYAGDDGDHDGDEAKFEAKGLKGAMEVTEGLLKRARSRWPFDKVAEHEWIRGGVQVQDGLKFKEEEEGEEVS